MSRRIAIIEHDPTLIENAVDVVLSLRIPLA
jgi:hypothetical protein